MSTDRGGSPTAVPAAGLARGTPDFSLVLGGPLYQLPRRARPSYDATNTFVLISAATVNLAACVTRNGVACQDAAIRPGDAPICPIVESTSRYALVMLRGGSARIRSGPPDHHAGHEVTDERREAVS